MSLMMLIREVNRFTWGWLEKEAVKGRESEFYAVIMSRLPRIRSEAEDGSSLKKAVSGLRVVLCVSRCRCRIDCSQMDSNSMSLITARPSERGRQTRQRDCSLFFLPPFNCFLPQHLAADNRSQSSRSLGWSGLRSLGDVRWQRQWARIMGRCRELDGGRTDRQTDRRSDCGEAESWWPSDWCRSAT